MRVERSRRKRPGYNGFRFARAGNGQRRNTHEMRLGGPSEKFDRVGQELVNQEAPDATSICGVRMKQFTMDADEGVSVYLSRERRSPCAGDFNVY